MAQRQLLVSSENARLLDAARRWLDERSPAGPALVLAGSLSAAAEVAQEGVAAGGGRLGLHRLTLDRFAAELAVRPLAAAALAPLTDLGAEALAAAALAASGEQEALTYFDAVADLPGMPRVLAATLRELRGEGIAAGALATQAPAGADLARLLGLYEESLESWALADRSIIYRLATEVARHGEHPLLGLPLLLLDFPLAAAVERSLLAAAAARSPDVLAVTVAADRETVPALEEALAAACLDLDDDAPERTSLARVRRRVFLPALPEEGGDEEDDTLVLVRAPGEGREAVEIARRVQRLAAGGLGFDRVAVLLRSPDAYQPVVEEALGRAGVPAYFTRGTTRPDPGGRAFLALLTCATENLSANRFAEYLSLGQVPAPPVAAPAAEPDWSPGEPEQFTLKLVAEGEEPEPEEEPPATDESPEIAGTVRAPARWERLLVEAAVVGGRDRWRRRLDGLEAELEARAERLASEEEPRRRALRDQMTRLRNLKSFALPLIEFLDGLPAEATFAVWIEHLERLAAVALRRPEKVLAVLAELRPMHRVGPVTLHTVRRTLERRLTQLRARPEGHRFGRVFVGAIHEARGRAFDVVFLPGLAEGSFPRRAFEDPLLLDDARRKLAAGLATQETRIARERLLLATAAAAARRQLVLSYPDVDALQGRARVPSFYVLDVLRAAEGRVPELPALERRAAGASASILGWPAPRDPAAAVDEAEYDLAYLEPLLRRPAAEVEGRGRYLLAANDALGRALRARARRWRRFFSAADGLVEPGEAAHGILAGHRLRARAYSATALQTWAACPYRFLLYAIHHLQPREEIGPLERLDPLTRGSLFHAVQFELFRELRQAGMLPMTAAHQPEILAAADRVLQRVAARYEENLCPAIPRVWNSEIEQLRIDLRGWVLEVVHETSTADEPWSPVHFEFAFGLPPSPDRDPESRREEAAILDGFRVRGAIDLVEERQGTLRVTDHKTGRAREEREIVVGGGEVLQPLVYALAAQGLFGRETESGRLFYCTRQGAYKPLVVALGPYQRQQIGDVLATVDAAVEQAFLPAAPRQGACRFCDYRPVCGPHEELRTARKELRPLAELRRIRQAG